MQKFKQKNRQGGEGPLSIFIFQADAARKGNLFH